MSAASEKFLIYLILLDSLFKEIQFFFPDNHDIISMKLYQLMVEHSPEEESQDWTKIEPSVSLLKSPKGRFREMYSFILYVFCILFIIFYLKDTFSSVSALRTHSGVYSVNTPLKKCQQSKLMRPTSPLTDNIDDPTGNFRGTPLTGWKVFLLLLCSLLGIVVCAVVGAVVFQKRQERNKRFY